MVALLFSAISVGAREVTRLRYVSDAFGSEFGIGTTAVVFALTLAVASVVAGRLVDTHDPRPYLVGSLVAGFVVTIINAWLLTRGQMPMGWLIPSVAIEAVTFGVGTTGLVKIQAAVVPPSARGTAETVNILRTGLGAAVGIVIAGVVDDPVVTLVLSAGITVLAAVMVTVVVWPIVVPRLTVPAQRTAELVRTVRSLPALRRTVTIDLVLAVVLPTQFIALVITDQDTTAITTLAFTASLFGVVTGRLVLVATGLTGNLTRRLRSSYLAFTAVAVAGTPALIDGWIIDRRVLTAVAMFIASALLAFSQNLPVALLQQQVPEAIRGSLSGAMNAARNLLIAATAVAVTTLTFVFSAAVLAGATVVLLLAGYAVAKRFTGLTADQ